MSKVSEFWVLTVGRLAWGAASEPFQGASAGVGAHSVVVE